MTFLYKWLPIFFGCHCRTDRSFIWHQRKFPICARCTGELLGIVIAPFLYTLLRVNLTISLLCLLPLIVDGFTQLLTKYESTNLRRLITGTLFGYGLATVVIASFIFISRLGYQWGQSL